MSKAIPSKIKALVFNNTPIDRILDVSEGGGWRGEHFYEVIGTAGGDALQYRFYLKPDGSLDYIAER